MNYVIRELTLYRHFLLIDSPIPFEFIANPTNYNKDMSDFSRVTGLDVCSRPSGCWRVDCWKLLPKEFQRNNPVFTMLLKYDADLLHEGEAVDVRYSDIDVGEGVAGVNGQLVQILPSTFQPVVNSVDALQTSNHADLGSVKNSVDALQTSSHADLGSVKNSVDALQTSNHADLVALKSSFLFSRPSWVSLIPESSVFPDTYVRFSLPFFDTFISLRYATIAPQTQNKVWHDNWVFVPRGVRFTIKIDFHSVIETSEDNLVYTLIYPVDGRDVSHEYKFTTIVPSYSVDAVVPSVLM